MIDAQKKALQNELNMLLGWAMNEMGRSRMSGVQSAFVELRVKKIEALIGSREEEATIGNNEI